MKTIKPTIKHVIMPCKSVHDRDRYKIVREFYNPGGELYRTLTVIKNQSKERIDNYLKTLTHEHA